MKTVVKDKKWAAENRGKLIAWLGCPGREGEPIIVRLVQVDKELCWVKMGEARRKAGYDTVRDIDEVKDLIEEFKRKNQAKSKPQTQPIIVSDPEPVLPPIEIANATVIKEEPKEDKMDETTGWYIVDYTNHKVWAGGGRGFVPISKLDTVNPLTRPGSVINTFTGLRDQTMTNHVGRYKATTIRLLTILETENFATGGELPPERPIEEIVQAKTVYHRQERETVVAAPTPKVNIEPFIIQGVDLPKTVLEARRNENRVFEELMVLKAQRAEMAPALEIAHETIKQAEVLDQQIVDALKKWQDSRAQTEVAVGGPDARRPDPLPDLNEGPASEAGLDLADDTNSSGGIADGNAGDLSKPFEGPSSLAG